MLIFLNAPAFSQAISFSSLLKQMPDNAQLAQFPHPFYQSLESSSYNRESVDPFKKGWFADSDGTGYIRKDTIDGRTEFVIIEHKGRAIFTYDENDIGNPTQAFIVGSTKFLARVIEIQNTETCFNLLEDLGRVRQN